MYKKLSCALVGAFLLALAGCDSAEERAEAHFQEGVALLESGDVDRALVEFRNVFNLNSMHREARRLYAEAEVDRGQVASGYSQYLRLVEQYPDDIDARRSLTELALDRMDWAEVERHGTLLIEAAAEDEVAQLADLVLRYRTAVEAEDEAERAAVVEEVQALRGSLSEPEPVLYQLTADHFIRTQDWEQALDEIDAGIAVAPDQRPLYGLRLGVLQELGDLDAVATQLREMTDLFPDDVAIRQTLVRWYLSQDNIDAAEQYLRERATAEAATQEDELAMIEFLRRYRGSEEALEEVEGMLASGSDNELLRSIRAGLMFEGGDREAAIAELQSLIDAAEEETDRTRNFKIALAQMLVRTGNQVGARALVEDVLASDPTHVAALKMRSEWLIEADQPEEAIVALREALEQSPRDAEIMTLMAQAHERSGNRGLMSEMLSLAVEASNSAPEETTRYARFLLSERKLEVAESALIDSLRLNPGNVELLRLLGAIYLQQQDWGRAEQVASTLSSTESEGADAAANSLRAELLAAQGQTEEVVGFLQQLVDQGQAGFGAQVAIFRSHIQNGDVEAARAVVDELSQEYPEEPAVMMLAAALEELGGNVDQAEATYREILDDHPESVTAWRALYLLETRAGRAEDAEQTLEAALSANPDSADLQWIRASVLQSQGDQEGALEIYASLYDQDTSSPIIANNYASLLSTLRDDEESIARAWRVARRLRDLEVPAFQDTFGWIAYLRGEYDVALEHLKPAAEALTGDPSVQYHLGMTYAALDRPQDAVAALERAIEIAGEGSDLSYIRDARAQIEQLAVQPAEN